MHNYARLKKIYESVYSRPRVVSAIRALAFGTVCFVVCALATVFLSLLMDGRFFECLRLITVSAIPFAVVSATRMFFDFKRPYEVIELDAFEYIKEERRPGKSFPSRHVFSAFLIGVLILEYRLPLGIMTLCVGVMMGGCRIALGIHFPKDVIAGAIIGVVSGVIGMLFL